MKAFCSYIIIGIIALLLLVSCSTRKNTASTRFWHSFTTRYNVYFNGKQAYEEGEKAKLTGHKDNYTEMLPVFLVGVENSRTTGKTNYETAITKCRKAISLHSIKRRPTIKSGKQKSAKAKAYLQRKEYNPFLKNAWMLMGISQFEKGEFMEAAATFSYITRLYAPEPEVANEARQWLARCYTQEKWYFDAEDALNRMRRDSVNRRTFRLANATQADLLLRQGQYEKALPYLERAAKQARGDYRQARLYYLLGQVNNHLHNNRAAYKALGKCIKKSPPYELAFHARIMQTEVMAAKPGMRKKMLGKLKRMARSDNNKDYLDQVYYAIGNIHLSDNDTLSAIRAYETGRAKSTKAGVEKAVLLLRLGGIYWNKRQFDKAQTCYTEAVGLVDKNREDYEEISRRSKVLDKLVPYTSAVYLQDSLQELARMSEADRNAAIDRVIEALKKKEAEERKAKRDSAAQARADENAQSNGQNNKNTPSTAKTQQDNKTWYFYNPMLVMAGKQDFQKAWGKRKNEDNWRRSNRTVITMDEGGEGFDYEADDSLRAATDSLSQKGGEEAETDTLDISDDPHNREYYLKQIPFTPEAKAASDAIIADGLFNAGVIEKDDLEDFPLAAETLTRLTNGYSEYEKQNEAWYHLFLLYSRWGKTEEARQARLYMAGKWPDDLLSKTINDPDFEFNARYGKQLEDSLYKVTYRAYRSRDNRTVDANYQVSTDKYPQGLNRPKFMLIYALAHLADMPTTDLIAHLRDLVSNHPDSEVSNMAGMMVRELEKGRKPGSGVFDLGSLWDLRTATADSIAGEAAASRKFTNERNVPFLFVLAYPADSLSDNVLLYEMAHFNFSTFVVRGFDMSIVHDKSGLSQFRVAGFNSYDEVHAYAQRVYRSKDLLPLLHKGRTLLVSKANLDLIGTVFSVNDYQRYFDREFAPIPLPEYAPIEQQTPIEQRYEDEYEIDDSKRPGNVEGDDEGDWY